MKVREVRLSYGDTVAEVDGRRVTGPDDVAKILEAFIGRETVEVFCLLTLDARHRVTGCVEISRGTLTASLVHPREVFRAAIFAGAAGIIVAHNHPSGDPAPSAEDREITARLVAAGELLGIQVLDHVVIGDPGLSYSFRETGSLKVGKS